MKNLEENNKLIAEFIEMQKTSIGWFDNEDVLNLPNTMDNTFDVLLFDVSWDWLMPCILKIIDFHQTNFYIEDPKYINTGDKFHFIMGDDCIFPVSGSGDTAIKAAYNGVVQYVKWHKSHYK